MKSLNKNIPDIYTEKLSEFITRWNFREMQTSTLPPLLFFPLDHKFRISNNHRSLQTFVPTPQNVIFPHLYRLRVLRQTIVPTLSKRS